MRTKLALQVAMQQAQALQLAFELALDFEQAEAEASSVHLLEPLSVLVASLA